MAELEQAAVRVIRSGWYVLGQEVAAFETEIHYPIPPHKQKAMKGILTGDWPLADELHATELSLPISVGHSGEDIRQVCEILHQFDG